MPHFWRRRFGPSGLASVPTAVRPGCRFALPFPIFKSSSDSRVALLQGLMIAALVIGALYVGRDVLLPLVVAILLSFVLTPPLIFLRKFKVPRVSACSSS